MNEQANVTQLDTFMYICLRRFQSTEAKSEFIFDSPILNKKYLNSECDLLCAVF